MKTQTINEKFGKWAEMFARFFGTPTFIIGQTIMVFIWVMINCFVKTTFDPYPFILLNLAFSTQAAYAAPLILLAQSRQTDRDKTWSEADANHREEVSQSLIKRQKIANESDKRMSELLTAQLQQNNTIIELTQRIESLALDIHKKIK